jgi:hypothetical protein
VEKGKQNANGNTPFASNCQASHFKSNPKEAWKMVFKLMEGFQTHQELSMPKKFKSKACVEAKTDEDNAKILNTHFHSLFNSQVKIDTTVLDKLPQYEINHTLGDLPSKSEIKNAIKKWPMINFQASQNSPRI